MDSFVVIGLGRFGSAVAKKLYEYKKDVLVIDRSQQKINSFSNLVTRAVAADGKDYDVLKKLGVDQCDCAIVAMSSDIATSVLTTMNLKKLGVKKVICKAHDETHREILQKLGADETVAPEHEIAEKLARFFASANILEKIELSDEYGIVECKVPHSWNKKTIGELCVRSKYGVNIIAVLSGDITDISPSPDFVLKEEQTLVLLGNYNDLDKFKKID